jgi:adenylate cyclase
VLYVVEGSVRRVGEKVTVNAQLISTDTGAHVWADRFDGERSKLGQLQVDFVARLAGSLDLELVRAEALRATRERPNNPDAVDLSMRGWMERYRNMTSRTNEDAAVGLFERALAVDPHLVRAMVGLAQTLANRVTYLHSDDPKSDNARAEDWAERAVAAEPYNSAAHVAKAQVFYNKRQWPRVMAEADAAVADNPNNATAHAQRGFYKLYLGRPEDGFPELKTAFRLSPRDPLVPVWQGDVCLLHTFLAQWEQAIEWCEKARAGLRIHRRWSISPPPTPGPATTRRPRRPWRNCRKSIPASPCRHMRACISATTRPTTPNARASSKACARPACPRGKRERIDLLRAWRRCRSF